MIIDLLILVLGLAILVKASDVFVDAAVRIARRLNVSSFVIGLTVVAVGTSLPELGVTITSIFSNTPSIGLGTLAGSTIADFGLLLGGAALVVPVLLSRRLFWKDIFFLFLAVALFFAFVFDGKFWWLEGLILLILFIAYMVEKVRSEKHSYVLEIHNLFEFHDKRNIALWRDAGILVLGLAVVLFSADIVVDRAVILATTLGVARSAIGAGIIAIGAVLPETLVTINSLRRGDTGLMVGNLAGSGITNLLLIGGLAGLLGSSRVDAALVGFIAPLLLIMTCLLAFFTYQNWTLRRREGLVFVILYVGFLVGVFLV